MTPTAEFAFEPAVAVFAPFFLGQPYHRRHFLTVMAKCCRLVLTDFTPLDRLTVNRRLTIMLNFCIFPECCHKYGSWVRQSPFSGFASVFRQFPLPGCCSAVLNIPLFPGAYALLLSFQILFFLFVFSIFKGWKITFLCCCNIRITIFVTCLLPVFSVFSFFYAPYSVFWKSKNRKNADTSYFYIVPQKREQ